MSRIVYENQMQSYLGEDKVTCFVQIREFEDHSFIFRKMTVFSDGRESVEETVIKFEQIDDIINEWE